MARQLIQARGLDLSETARALALVYLASADASIACWTAKYTFNFWRPITAIRNGDVDDNVHTVADPDLDAAVSDPAASRVPVRALDQQQRDGDGPDAAVR